MGEPEGKDEGGGQESYRTWCKEFERSCRSLVTHKDACTTVPLGGWDFPCDMSMLALEERGADDEVRKRSVTVVGWTHIDKRLGRRAKMRGGKILSIVAANTREECFEVGRIIASHRSCSNGS